jgi:hypothetical protein
MFLFRCSFWPEYEERRVYKKNILTGMDGHHTTVIKSWPKEYNRVQCYVPSKKVDYKVAGSYQIFLVC